MNCATGIGGEAYDLDAVIDRKCVKQIKRVWLLRERVEVQGNSRGISGRSRLRPVPSHCAGETLEGRRRPEKQKAVLFGPRDRR